MTMQQRQANCRFDSGTLYLRLVVRNRATHALRDGERQVTRGDAVRLLPAGGSSRRVGKFRYAGRVEIQTENRRGHVAVLLTEGDVISTDRRGSVVSRKNADFENLRRP